MYRILFNNFVYAIIIQYLNNYLVRNPHPQNDTSTKTAWNAYFEQTSALSNRKCTRNMRQL